MKTSFTFFNLILFAFAAFSQSVVLHLDGEAPNPFEDNSGNNIVSTVGAPLNTGAAIEFPTGDDYLIIDQFATFDLQANWSVEFKIYMTDAMDSVFPIDWRSNSNVGHMHIGYNGVRGIYLSDRTQNGIYGSLIDDPDPVPANSWVSFKVQLIGDSLEIWRDGIRTASAFFNGTFSELSTTTIGYSEDFRYDHSSFMLDDLIVTANPTTGIEETPDLIKNLYPNPTNSFFQINLAEPAKSIELISIDGQVIRSLNPKSETINVNDVPAGFYMVRIVSENGYATSQLIIQ